MSSALNLARESRADGGGKDVLWTEEQTSDKRLKESAINREM